uniref:Uncharacterized protein ycf23 n=1 Tax=Rhizophora mucronata TaxID=61149 RepID=A0A2P2JCQ0_RHIMU
MHSSICMPMSPSSRTLLKPNHSPLQGAFLSPKPFSTTLKRGVSLATRARLATIKEMVLKDFHERRALKIISGLQNFNKENVAAVVTAADKGGASHVDIACDLELVELAVGLTSLPVNSYSLEK